MLLACAAMKVVVGLLEVIELHKGHTEGFL